jgi:hypothetical protein
MTLAVNIAQGGSNNVTFRNRLINSAMVIDQRNAGVSVTVGTGNTYILDRYKATATQASKFTVQQNAGSVTPPTGFSYYSGATSSSAYAVISSDHFEYGQNIEGYNVADLAWGTASASAITISFWVRSSLTGTFGGVVQNSAQTRSYPFSYTISTANTWEYETITIAGDTSGTWLTTNGIGMRLTFSLGAGSTYSTTANAWAAGEYYQPTGATSVVGTSGATFYITGVQLEAGTTASPFEYRQYGTELALCQRYYFQTWGFGSFANNGAGYVGQVLPAANNATSYGSSTFSVSMRAAPTVTTYDSTGSSGNVSQPAIANGIAATAGSISISGFTAVTKTTTTFTVGTPVICQYIASIEL